MKETNHLLKSSKNAKRLLKSISEYELSNMNKEDSLLDAKRKSLAKFYDKAKELLIKDHKLYLEYLEDKKKCR